MCTNASNNISVCGGVFGGAMCARDHARDDVFTQTLAARDRAFSFSSALLLIALLPSHSNSQAQLLERNVNGAEP